MTLSFKTLLKRELKDQFSLKKKENKDLFGLIFSLIMTIGLAVALAYVFYSIVNTYVHLKHNMVANIQARTNEILTCFYAVTVIFGTLFGIEKMRKMFILGKDKDIFLKLPVKQTDIFISKLVVLYISIFTFMITFIVPINVIFGLATKANITFWFLTVLIVVLLPSLPFVFSALLVFPYIKLISVLKNHYIVTGIIFTGILVGAFILYNQFLEILQSLLETGRIKYLFNARNIGIVQNISSILYPTKCFSNIITYKNMILNLCLIMAFVGLGLVLAYYLSHKFFFKMIYALEKKAPLINEKKEFKERKVKVALIKKEFDTVLRNSSFTFGYFSVAIAMPLMVYCCVTLFNSLIFSALGFTLHFEISLMVMIVFVVLTNTFCASNISREGTVFLKSKTLPIKASTVVDMKVLFCFIVSGVSIVISSLVLLFVVDISVAEFFIVLLVSLFFSLSQILLATKMDLLKPSFGEEGSKTTTKIVFIGLLFSLVLGVIALVIRVYYRYYLQKETVFVYLFVIVSALLYGLFTYWYYKRSLEEKYYSTR